MASKRRQPEHRAPYTTYAEYDDEAGRWATTASQIPGLAASHKEITGLVKAVDLLTPVLMQANVFQSPKLPTGYKHDCPSELGHEIVVLRPNGRYDRIQAAKIDAHALINGPALT
jgi:hypothetical protein